MKALRKHIYAVLALLFAACMFLTCGAFGLWASADEAESGSGSGDGEARYKIDAPAPTADGIRFKMDNVGYKFDYTWATDDAAWYGSSVAAPGKPITVRYQTVVSEGGMSTSASMFGPLVRDDIPGNRWAAAGGNGCWWVYNGPMHAVGEVTEIKYLGYSEGKTASNAFEAKVAGTAATIFENEKDNWTANPYPGVKNDPTANTAYICIISNAGMTTAYTASLVDFAIVDDTGYDLGLTWNSINATKELQGKAGKTITFKAPALSEIEKYVVTTADGTDVPVTDNKDGTYSFTMPAADVELAKVVSYDWEGYAAIEAPEPTEEGIRFKMDNAGYMFNFGWDNNGWYSNSVPAPGESLSIHYQTAAFSGNVGTVANLCGPVLLDSVSDGDGWIYGGASACWYAYDGMLHSTEGATDIVYKTGSNKTNAFTTTVNGNTAEVVVSGTDADAWTGGPHPAGSHDPTSSTAYIGVAWNQGNYSGLLYDMKIVGNNGYDLGLKWYRQNETVDSYADLYGKVGSDVTFKAGAEVRSFTLKDAEGNDVQYTDNGDGTYTFTMPEGGVKLEVAEQENIANFAGGYRNGGDYLFIGDSSWILKDGTKTEISGVVFAGGTLYYTAGGRETTGTYTKDGGISITIDSTAYASDKSGPVFESEDAFKNANVKSAAYKFTLPAADEAYTAIVLLNGEPVTGSNGVYDFTLQKGANTVVVTAVDPVGNRTVKTFTLTADFVMPEITTDIENEEVENATYTFTASATNAKTFTVTLNGETVSGENGSYTVTLSEGKNTIVITAVEEYGNFVREAYVVILKDTTDPVITTSAANGTVSKAEYAFGVSVNETATVSVTLNGTAVAGENGQYTVTLNKGENTIVITATDMSGNDSSQTIKVTFNEASAPVDPGEPGEPSEPGEGGCGASLATSALVVAAAVLAASATILFIRKKKAD